MQIDIIEDNYTEQILINRYKKYTDAYMYDKELKKSGFNIRHQNMPEDISENIVKFIVRNYEKDMSCVWPKATHKKYGLVGDLYSNKYEIMSPIEVKSFTSDGPIQFGPSKKFSVLYFLDMRNILTDNIVLWKVELNNESPVFKNIKINKSQSHSEQCSEGRRPRIPWNQLYPQIKDYCTEIYNGHFNGIFTES